MIEFTQREIAELARLIRALAQDALMEEDQERAMKAVEKLEKRAKESQ